ncbi:glyoxalase [Intrasporangium oryzae NRRL B-24470]|uniref:Glyoxalase n=1 Tax=Intrasporangium oryzae NRRL B-24470 TaxID=1386089 RepID=W9GB57_9MICO|nr:glyoxalase [Intrasporangium oryzae NRRL B-24470]
MTATTVNTVVYPVTDLAAAKTIFTRLLAAEPHTDQPYYVGWNVGGQEIALDPNGHAKGLTGPVPYWHVDDVPAHVAGLVEAGATVRQQPTDVGGGKLTAVLADPDGNVIGLVQA